MTKDKLEHPEADASREPSERAHAEQRIARSQATIDAIFRAAPIGIGMVIDRVFSEVNAQLCSMLGYEKEALIGQSARMLYTSEDEFERVGQEKYRDIDSFGVGNVETQWKRKDGHLIDILLSSAPCDPEDLSTGVVFTALDITETMRTEEERARLFTLSLDMVYVADMEGRFKELNPAWSSVLGWTTEELLSIPWMEFVHPDDTATTIAAAEGLSEGRPVFGFENRYRCKDGSYRQLSWNAYSSVEDGTIVGIARDVTEEKHDAEERAMLERQLMQAQKMEAIGTLAGGIAHDFNNILTGLIGYTSLAMEDVEQDSEAIESLNKVMQGCQRAQDLVHQILTFSRKSDQQRQSIHLHSVVKEAMKLLRGSLPSTIEIRMNVDPICPPVFADAGQIHQVVMNLCTNAYHAMRDQAGNLGEGGQSVLTVDVGPFDISEELAVSSLNLRPGRYAKMTVRDTGAGIDASIVERIFDPYFTTKVKGEGTGLGLAMVHSIVQAHFGAITVESERGVGTSFEVFLPLADNSDRDDTLLAQISSSSEGTEHVLLVDDEHTIVDLGKRVLERRGYLVTTSTHPKDALELFTQSPQAFDVVITDLTMPKMTGVELGLRIRQLRPEIPLILCTGFSDSISEPRALDLGFSALLRKPFTSSDFASAIRKIIDETN